MKKYLIGVFVVVLTGCASTKVSNTKLDEHANWSYYKTFDFYQLNMGSDTIAPATIECFTTLKAALNDEMQKAGFKRSNIKPDLLVNIGLAVKEGAPTKQDGLHFISQRNYYWKTEEIAIGQYSEGSAVIDLVDAASKMLVWSSTLKKAIPNKTEKVQESIKNGVEQLFKQNPVPTNNKLLAATNAQ